MKRFRHSFGSLLDAAIHSKRRLPVLAAKTIAIPPATVLILVRLSGALEAIMDPETTDRRTARRFNLALPLLIRFTRNGNTEEKIAHTRDVSFRGLYFMMDAPPEQGSSVEIVLTLPQQITLAGEVRIRCFANIIRVEERDNTLGVAASIDRYEFLSAAA